MSDRRDFLKLSVAVGGAGTLAACSNFNGTQTASSTSPPPAQLPKGIIYSRENPGQWAKKVGGHAPVITIEGRKVTVKTKHGMSKKHFIVRHTIVSLEGEVLGENTFSPDDDEPISVFELPAKHEDEELYATSFCNKHDMWVEKFKI